MSAHKTPYDPYLEAELAYRRERMIQDWNGDSWWTRLRHQLHPEETGPARRTQHRSA